MKLIARVFLASLLAGAAPLGIASARPWTLADVVSSPFMDDVRLSPNAATALVEVDTTDLAHNTFASSYRAVTMATGASEKVASDLDRPRWSPDSRRVAWLAPVKGSRTLVLTDSRGGARRALDGGGRNVIAFAWSPDGQKIAAIETPASAGAGGRLFWLNPESDYRGTRPPRRSLWLVDVRSGAQREITRDSWSYGGPETDHDPSWSADGMRVAVVRQPTPLYGDFEHAQYVAADVRGGAVAQIVDHPFFAYPASAPPVFGPAGEIAYTHTWDGNLPSREDVFISHVILSAARSAAVEGDVSAALDRDLWSCGNGTIEWNGGMLVAGMMDGAAVRLYRLDPTGARPPEPLTPQDGSVIASSIADDGTIAYLWTTSQALPELYVRDPRATVRQVTHLLQLPPGLPVANTAYFRWSGSGGRTLHGLLTRPVSAAPASAPLVVEPHGGPQCAEPIGFSPVAQYFASNGYAYFRPDPPGSDGYGDWSYKAIVGNWGPVPMDADLAGIDAVLRAGVGDSKRLFIEGGSYGGYLTSWIVTHTDRFRAAVAEVPVTNLGLDYALSESPNITRRFFGAKPLSDPVLLAQQSPLEFTAQMRTPLLLISGLRDTRAPYVQAIEFYKALQENGAPVKMLADPKAGHGPDDPEGGMLWLGAIAAWFAQYGGLTIPGATLP